MSTVQITNQISALREQLNNIAQSEKDRATSRESIKEELRKLLLQVDESAATESEEMAQAAERLKTDIERTEAEQERQAAEAAENRANLNKNVKARIAAASGIDKAIKTLSIAIEKYLAVASETDLLAELVGRTTPATSLFRAKIDTGEIIRQELDHFNLAGISNFVSGPERKTLAQTEETSATKNE